MQKSILFSNQFVALSSVVDDADVGIAGEAVAETGDEDLKAAGIEEVVFAPKEQKDVLGGNDAAAAFA